MSNIVIIPTYKEKENIEAIVSAISSLPLKFDILIIDDNSPDGTADLVKNLQRQIQTSTLLKDRGNLDWVQLILQVSNGPSKKVMTIFMKWMQIFHTIPVIW